MKPREAAAVPKEARNGARVKVANVAPQGVYLPNNNRLTPAMRLNGHAVAARDLEERIHDLTTELAAGVDVQIKLT